MKKLIELDAALDALGEPPVVLWEYMDDYTLGERNQYDKDRLAIESVPTIDAVPVVHGQWIIGDDGSLHCSECSKIPISRIIVHGIQIFDMTPVKEMMKYCPNCGAKMGEEDSDNE